MSPTEDHPRDPQAPNRFLCSPEHPMPSGASGQWSHTLAECTGSCSDGCCDYFRCATCGVTWKVEYSH